MSAVSPAPEARANGRASRPAATNRPSLEARVDASLEAEGLSRRAPKVTPIVDVLDQERASAREPLHAGRPTQAELDAYEWESLMRAAGHAAVLEPDRFGPDAGLVERDADARLAAASVIVGDYVHEFARARANAALRGVFPPEVLADSGFIGEVLGATRQDIKRMPDVAAAQAPSTPEAAPTADTEGHANGAEDQEREPADKIEANSRQVMRETRTLVEVIASLEPADCDPQRTGVDAFTGVVSRAVYSEAIRALSERIVRAVGEEVSDDEFELCVHREDADLIRAAFERAGELVVGGVKSRRERKA